MGVAQEIFNQALADYNKALGYLDELGEVNKKLDAKFSSEALKRQFDIILQTTLLRTAVADSDYSRIERDFIEQITTYGDLMNWIHYKFDVDISWDKLSFLPENKISELLDLIYEKSNDLMADFFLHVMIGDSLTKFNYSKAIIEQVVSICSAFTYIDGDGDDQDEDQGMFRAIECYFENPVIAAGKALIKVLGNGKNGNSSKSVSSDSADNTLASAYEKLKKN